ncbi:38871_t:CDS:2, partial [Gigaspora margarita]
MPKEFEQLKQLPNPIPGEDLHYKLFEKLYGTLTTEEHRPFLKNSKLITSKTSKKIIKKLKHTMPFCPSAARAKNVGITVFCVECEKSQLLFSLKKLTNKNREKLKRFLNTILYTCGMSFHNTCDLSLAIATEQADTQIINSDATNNSSKNITNSNDMDDDNIEPDGQNHDGQNNDNQNNDDQTEKFGELAESDYSDEDEEINIDNPIRMLFEQVFVNDLWTCALPIENPYYSVGIYPDICYNCGGAEDLKATKGELPLCVRCNGIITPKKRLKWKQVTHLSKEFIIMEESSNSSFINLETTNNIEVELVTSEIGETTDIDQNDKQDLQIL